MKSIKTILTTLYRRRTKKIIFQHLKRFVVHRKTLKPCRSISVIIGTIDSNKKRKYTIYTSYFNSKNVGHPIRNGGDSITLYQLLSLIPEYGHWIEGTIALAFSIAVAKKKK
jgi:hypothetical protein